MKKLLLTSITVLLLAPFIGAQSSFGHVDTQKILDTMPSRKVAQKEIKQFRDRAMREMQESEEKLVEDYQKLQSEKNNMSPTAYRFEENRLMKKQQELQERSQELEQQIQILNQELNGPVLDRVQKAIESVAQKEKIDYVLDESALLYAKGKDMTNKVIVEVLKLEKDDPITDEVKID